MQDIINSFKAHLYERTSSPLIGSFIFYWFICNYKLVMVILDGDMKLNEKFDLIKILYPQNIWTPWEGFDIHYSTLLGNGLLMPLLITLAYIFIIPYPAKFVYSFWKNKQKEIQEIKQKIDDETPLTKEQSKKIRQDMINLEIEYEKLLKHKDEEIVQLKEKMKENEITIEKGSTNKKTLNTIMHFDDEVNSFEENTLFLTKIHIDILDAIGNTKNNQTTALTEKLGMKLIPFEIAIDELINAGCIIVKKTFRDGEKEYELTELGRKRYINELKKF